MAPSDRLSNGGGKEWRGSANHSRVNDLLEAVCVCVCVSLPGVGCYLHSAVSWCVRTLRELGSRIQQISQCLMWGIGFKMAFRNCIDPSTIIIAG